MCKCLPHIIRPMKCRGIFSPQQIGAIQLQDNYHDNANMFCKVQATVVCAALYSRGKTLQTIKMTQ